MCSSNHPRKEASHRWRDPSPSCAAQDDTALCLNLFTTDLRNHPKHVLDEPTVAADKILAVSPSKRAEMKL